MTIQDDRTLVTNAVAGSETGGNELFGRHWLWAWRLALSLTKSPTAADDVAQDAFERAFRGLPGFNGRSSFRTWLARIVVNRSIDYARRERSPDALDDVRAEWAADDAVRDRDLLDAVLALPLERRTVIVLRYWARHAPSEIAEILGVPLGTVHSRLARALEDLRSRLEDTDAPRP